MNSLNFLRNILMIAALIMSIISMFITYQATTAAKDSANAAKEQQEYTKKLFDRYYDEIVFIGKLGENNLIIDQPTGTKYFLKRVELTPHFLNDRGGLEDLIGLPYDIDLTSHYDHQSGRYIIKEIHKRICSNQIIDNCEEQKFTNILMKYQVYGIDKSKDITPK